MENRLLGQWEETTTQKWPNFWTGIRTTQNQGRTRSAQDEARFTYGRQFGTLLQGQLGVGFVDIGAKYELFWR